MEITDVTIIVPIYNLHRHRLNNFCFVIEKLSELANECRSAEGCSHRCNVIVSEQISDKTEHIERILLKYLNVRHIISHSKLETINKSELINVATYNSSSEYIWVVDADFYTNFKQVVQNIPRPLRKVGTLPKCDFIRPFNRVVFLSEEESIHLISENTMELTQTKYETNKQDGKFSFIINREHFLSAHGMNTDFVGWGFQDLDFVENRLATESTKSYVDIQGYHLWHERASNSNIQVNRQLYVNYGGKTNLLPNPQYRRTIIYQGDEEFKSKPKESTTLEIKEVPPPPRVVVSETKPQALTKSWSIPSRGIFYANRSNTFKCMNTNIRIVSDSHRIILKSTTTGLKKISLARPFLYHYIDYINREYSTILENETVMFVNDSFVKVNADIKQMNKIMVKVNAKNWHKGIGPGFSWLTETFAGNAGTNPVKYAPSGCFLIRGGQILNNPKAYYENLLQQMRKWQKSDYDKFLKVLVEDFA